MSDKEPLRIVVSNLVPTGILPDLRDRVKNQDWNSFFTSLIGVGSVSFTLSLGIVLIAVFSLRIVSGSFDILQLITNILKNITWIAIVVYVLGIILLSAVRSAVDGEPAFNEPLESLEGRTGISKEHTLVKFSVYMLNALLLVLFIWLIYIFRSEFVLSVDIIGSTSGIIPKIVLGILISGLDLAYLGLVLISVGQIYETGKSIRNL